MPFDARRRRWSLLVAAATAGMVLVACLVLYLRIEEYSLREIDGELDDVGSEAYRILATARDEATARRELGRLTAGGTLSIQALKPWAFTVGLLDGHAESEFGYPFRGRGQAGPGMNVTVLAYLRNHERRLKHHQLWMGMVTAGSFLVSWALASWAARRLFGPLEEAYRRESAFAADVAHELRTPLTRMQGELEMAQRDGREDVSSVLEEVRRLSDLVNHLLMLARAEAGQEPLAMASVDLTVLCRELEEAFGPVAEEKGLKLRVKAPPALSVRGDRMRLRQALANLLENAIRHTATGEIVLKAESGMLSVTDTGVGIPPEHQGRVFERFYRVPGSPEGGSGLGLAFVQWVAVAHGGHAFVESVPGKGSVFQILLPA